MRSTQIEARAIAKIAAISLLIIAIAVLLAIVLLHTRTALRWTLAAVFLALALNPAVSLASRIDIAGRRPPRWAAILIVFISFAIAFAALIVIVIPPIVREIEMLARQLPTYVKDFEDWAEQSAAFRELNDRFDLTQVLSEQASSLPAKLGDAAGTAGSITVGLVKNLVAAITVLALAFFLSIDGKRFYESGLSRLSGDAEERGKRIGVRIAGVVRSYVSVTLLLSVTAGIFTWLACTLLGIDLAVPLAVIVAFCNLIPLVGLTIGGSLVAIVAAFHAFPGALIAWVVMFLIYQQLQDRVFQPLLFKGAVRVNPAVAIIAILVGAELAGLLGAVLAIPTASTIGVLVDELLLRRDGARQGVEPAAEPAGS
ncbi:AI-2E family transporter [Thermoleophilia bacterium SCSIO 60948]|nr:AI-2E family transporter [Thermoleophilia bacterium SCSIO 60948]